MNDFDRELIALITDVDGEVWPLSELVDLRGATLVSRVVADGFAEVFRASDEDLFQPLSLAARLDPEWRYLTTEEALQTLQQDRIPDDHRIAEVPGAVDLRYDPTLVLSYAADEPAAVAKVRRQNEEGREQWQRERRALLRRIRKAS